MMLRISAGRSKKPVLGAIEVGEDELSWPRDGVMYRRKVLMEEKIQSTTVMRS